jgi:hypothetical protein
MLGRAEALVASGVNLMVLLALSDDGRPGYDANHAGKLAALGGPVFACTPDMFPDLMAAALRGKEVRARHPAGAARMDEGAGVRGTSKLYEPSEPEVRETIEDLLVRQ